ncbi:MAG: phosphomannomutase/phosphoglucomutase [Planctomycetes bacterium]|nr:phosphomannomutase/phosphoglucomutase [Planctomycetota bacterium]
MSVFKAYDIRGIYGSQIDAALAEKIGRAFTAEVKPRTVVIGHDMRPSAPEIAQALARGLTATGVEVVRIGLCSTPVLSFALGRGGFDGGIMVTASHNPAEYIGMKLARKGAVPIGRDSGIAAMEARIRGGQLPADAPKQGHVREASYTDAYVDMVVKHANFGRRLKVVADAGNGMGGWEFPLVAKRLDLEVVPLYFELDGTFPNHEANPLDHETLADLEKRVKKEKADLGIAFDGDADRAGFVDEKGGIITNDLATALMAADILSREKGPVVYDLRSSRALPEEIARHGGKPIRGRVGHSFMKNAMREHGCVFGGEYSGHYYFRENYNTESSSLAVVAMCNIVSRAKAGVSGLLKPLRRYIQTGEVNFRVEDKDGKMKEIEAAFKDGEIDWLDGVTVQYEDWWCNVRPSNTEPLLRLNLEANTKAVFEKQKKKVFAILGTPV